MFSPEGKSSGQEQCRNRQAHEARLNTRSNNINSNSNSSSNSNSNSNSSSNSNSKW